MSEESKVSDQSEIVSDDQESKAEDVLVEQKNNVAYETHRKLLGEKKKLQQQFQEVQNQMQQINEDKLSAEGKKDELISSLQKRLKETTDSTQQKEAKFAFKTVAAQVEAEAAKMGCIDGDLALMALKDDLKTLNVADDYSVDSSDVKGILENLKSHKPHLFQKSAPKIIDGVPATGDLKQTDWKKTMTLDQKLKLLSEKLGGQS